jgi:enoyl-CoA hydratase
MSNFEFLAFENHDGIGLLTINREDKLNALNELVLTELKTFLSNIKDYQLNGLILTGAGEKSFIAGADIAGMNEMSVKEAEAFAHLGQEVSFLLENASIPVIAAVNGFALGGGCEMALACDFIYASENAIFGLPEVSLGLIPGFGGTQRLAKVIGRNKAKELIYTAGKIKAEEAKVLGLVNKVFSTKEELVEESKKTMMKIKNNSPYAISISKRVVNKGVDYGNRDGLKLEKEEFSRLFTSYDMKEGTTAFMEKRKPNFKGE